MGNLTAILAENSAGHARRDLVRARDDAKKVELAARHRLDNSLLRHDRKCPRPTVWIGIHLEWIRVQAFEHEAQAVAARALELESTHEELVRMEEKPTK